MLWCKPTAAYLEDGSWELHCHRRSAGASGSTSNWWLVGAWRNEIVPRGCSKIG